MLGRVGGGDETVGVRDSDESPTFISYIRLAQRAEGTTDWFLRERVLGKLKQWLEWDMQLSLHFSLFFQCTTFSHWDNGPMRGKYCQGKYRGNDAKSANKAVWLWHKMRHFAKLNDTVCAICVVLWETTQFNYSWTLWLDEISFNVFTFACPPVLRSKIFVLSFVARFVISSAKRERNTKSLVVARHKII